MAAEVASLESRVLLAATNPFELSSLLASNGGNGSTGFTVDGTVSNGNAGSSVANAGDVNGDGLDDLLIGSPGEGRGQGLPAATGKAHLVFGAIEGTQASLSLSTLNGTNGFTFSGAAAGDEAGSSVSGAGDVNGDGFADLLIGAPHPSLNAADTSPGLCYLVFGGSANLAALDAKDGTTDGQIQLSVLDGTTGLVLNGVAVGDRCGAAVSGAGDVNGDGFDDLSIGAPGAAVNAQTVGHAYLVLGGQSNLAALDGANGSAADGKIALANLNGTTGFTFNGIAVGDRCGVSVSGAGDLNGDGLSDLLIGAPYADPSSTRGDQGQIYVVFGGFDNLHALDVSNGGAQDGQIALSALNGSPTTGFVLNGVAPVGYKTGNSVRGAGDVNGDGFDDLIIGGQSVLSGGGSNGQLYLIFGGWQNLHALDIASGNSQDGRFDLSSLNGSTGFVFAANFGINSSFPASGAGDLNGDGFDDLLIGDSYNNLGYVVFGGSALRTLDTFGGSPSDGRIDLSKVDGTTGFRVAGLNQAYPFP